jgi:ethanolaminephosphotransferase
VQFSSSITIRTLLLLAALRITRRWNQTGQKFAGESDIARTILSSHTELLWSLIGATYLWNTYSLATTGFPRLSRQPAIALSAVLLILALSFKTAFTNEDAPELMGVWAKFVVDSTAGWDLVSRARTVFHSVGICLAFIIGCEFWYSTKLAIGFRHCEFFHCPIKQ